MNNPKFELFLGKDDEYYFRLTAKNGQTILTSEGYKAKGGALNGIESVKENAPDPEQYERCESGDHYYFLLKAKNRQTIGRSEMYNSVAAMDNGIESVMENAPIAPIDDQTD